MRYNISVQNYMNKMFPSIIYSIIYLYNKSILWVVDFNNEPKQKRKGELKWCDM